MVRMGICTLILFLLRIAECSFFGRIKILPAAPDLILAALTAMALIDKRERALTAAIIGGVLTDAIGGTGIYLSPLFYFAVVLILTSLSGKMMRSFWSFAALMPLSILQRALYTLLRGYLFGNGLGVTELLRYACLPEAICTAVFCLGIYPIIYLCSIPVIRDKNVHR